MATGERGSSLMKAISQLESIRQTLMTHMWPDMVRKPLGVSMPPISFEDDDEHPPMEEEEEEQDAAEFPVSFSIPSSSSAGKDREEGKEAQSAFPSMQELLSQLSQSGLNADAGRSTSGIATEEWGGLSGMDENQRSALERLEMLELDDELFGELAGMAPGAEEYARLDDWLDEDEPGLGGTKDAEGDEDEFVMLDNNPSGSAVLGEASRPPRAPEVEEGEGEGFEDDFAAFQSAPSAHGGGRSTGSQLPLDPTPLLLHLQAVRAELMSVQDPEERRKRAGKEVEMIMRGLGMEEGLGLDELDEEPPKPAR